MDKDECTERKNVPKKNSLHSLSTTDTENTDLGFVREDESIQSLKFWAKNVDKDECSKTKIVLKKKPII